MPYKFKGDNNYYSFYSLLDIRIHPYLNREIIFIVKEGTNPYKVIKEMNIYFYTSLNTCTRFTSIYNWLKTHPDYILEEIIK